MNDAEDEPMSNELDDANAMLMQKGAKAFAFNNIGDVCTGTVLSMNTRQQTDIETGTPQSWPDGRPKMMVVIVLQTETQDDENDDGQRSVFLRGGNYSVASGKGTSSSVAVRDAVVAAGASGIEVGGRLSIGYTGQGQKSNNAFTAPKLYTAKYEPPVARVGVEELF